MLSRANYSWAKDISIEAKARKSHDSVEFSRLLWRATRAVTRVYRRRAAEMELTERQASAILTVVNTPAITLGQLAEKVGADQPTASALVDRLLAADLVQRETHADDRRRVSLRPTDKALRLAEGLEAAREEAEAQIWAILGKEDAEELIRILARLIETLSEQRKLAETTVEGKV
jgi:DNA-binding MarR family transcriptional regulator